MTNVRAPIPFCSKLDQLHWPFFLWNMSRCLIWSVPDLLCPWSTTLPCISSASTHPWWPLSQTCSAVSSVSNASQTSLQDPLSSSHGVLLSRLPKEMFPTNCSHPCVVWGSVSSCLPVTAQARIALPFTHLFFSHIPCSYLIFST